MEITVKSAILEVIRNYELSSISVDTLREILRLNYGLDLGRLAPRQLGKLLDDCGLTDRVREVQTVIKLRREPKPTNETIIAAINDILKDYPHPVIFVDTIRDALLSKYGMDTMGWQPFEVGRLMDQAGLINREAKWYKGKLRTVVYLNDRSAS